MSKTFTYTARTHDGQRQTGSVQADDSKHVAAILARKQLIPTRIKLKRNTEKAGLFGFMKSHRYEDLILFTRNLGTLYRAGIPILQALAIIKIGDEKSYFNKALAKIRSNINSGRSLADSMAEFPDIFPKIYIASIAAGEQSGTLEQIMESLGNMLEKDLALNRQIKSSIRYPIFIVAAITGAFVVLISFVIPRFINFYSKMGAELPLPTRMLIWINQTISHYWIPAMAMAVILFFLFRKIRSTPGGKHFLDMKILTLPIFGDLIVKGNVARFSYIFQVLLKSGMPVVRTLDMLSGVVKNSQLTMEIKSMADSFREGRELSSLGNKLTFFPEMAIHMIRVGLESGSLESMLEEVSNHYSKEVDYKSRHLTAVLEPILTIVLGGFVLIVALAIFLPMWNLIQVFKG
nr:type II secretion system F family protein [candidate division Zixibacteria bacterium]